MATKKTTTKKKTVEAITLDKKPVDINITQEKEIIPKSFTPEINIPVKKEDIMFINPKNGKVYKKLPNGKGMYLDNGMTFDLKELD